MATIDPSLQSAIDALSFPGVMLGHRLISPGDENALLPEETPVFASSVLKVRRASGAARIVLKDQSTLVAAVVVLASGNQGSAFAASVWAGRSITTVRE